MTRFEIAAPCHVPALPGGGAGRHAAWIEAALLVRVTVPEWQYGEETWVHWTASVGEDGRPIAVPRRFDPGRFAVAPGEPDPAVSKGAVRVGEADARKFVAGVLAQWNPVVHRQSTLGLVSRLDEPRDEFRKRCLALLRPLLHGGGADRDAVASRLAQIAAGIESEALRHDRFAVRHARIGLVWYPDGREPAAPAAELMIAGGVRGNR